MAARPTWKGFLKVSLVTIPVKVFPATESAATLSFNQLHGECQTRIQQKRWCPHCDREVASADIVKGYEFEKGRYVVVSDEDIQNVRVDSTRVARDRPRAVHRRHGHRSDLRRPGVLPRSGRSRGRGIVCGDAGGDGGQGRHRQGGPVRPRVPGGRQVAGEGSRHVHPSPRRGDSPHRPDRGIEFGAREGEARRDEARPAGHRDV